MALVTDENHMAAMAHVAQGLLVDLRHQRAGRVEIEHVTRLGLGRHRFRHAVGGKDHRLTVVGNLVEFLDEDRAHVTQTVDHIAVVDDLVAHIDRGAVLFQRQDDDLNRPLDTGAKAARLAEADGQAGRGGRGRRGDGVGRR